MEILKATHITKEGCGQQKHEETLKFSLLIEIYAQCKQELKSKKLKRIEITPSLCSYYNRFKPEISNKDTYKISKYQQFLKKNMGQTGGEVYLQGKFRISEIKRGTSLLIP